jgi:hypothetical protein
VDNPVVWSLENARQPILERASAGLRKLTPADDQRIVRLVTRRCRLNLLELRPGRVVVHHWGQQGQADLRHFFKAHGLAWKVVQVALIDRKRETTTLQHGDDFLYGERLAEGFPVRAYLEKWRRRYGVGQNQAVDVPQRMSAASAFRWSKSCPIWKTLPQPFTEPWPVLRFAGEA